jgi:PKD repeat protein
MKYFLLPLLFSLVVLKSTAQSPDYFYFDPPNAGVNNLYFNTGVSFKCLFIYTQSELASTGISGAIKISSIWLKSNSAYNITFENLKITLGHSTLNVPSTMFADNFDAGIPTTVLNEPYYAMNFVAGPWNDPPTGWTEIPLTTPFIYNFTDNLAIQFEYTDDNYPIPLYAFNGGPAITQYTDTIGGIVATDNTARPMIGLSGPISPIFIAASDSAVCEKFCIDFTDLSINNPVAWNWTFEGGSPSSSTVQNPIQICYNDPGIYDVTLITIDALGESDTLYLPDFIITYATPPPPTITQHGDTLISSAAAFYQWQFNTADIPGATDQTYVAGQNGLYTMVATDSSGCFSSASLDVEVVGVYDVQVNNHWNIYPNPSSGIFTVTTDNCKGDILSLAVFNLFGEKRYFLTGKLFSPSCERVIDLNEPDGIYFVEIKSAVGSFRKKIIIEN